MKALPKLVAFDLYGTLIQFGVKHRPFKKVLQWAKDNGRMPNPDDARSLMTRNEDTARLLVGLGIDTPANILDQLHREIHEELDSLTLFDDVRPALNALTQNGIPMAICSNLAKPYGAIVDKLLPDYTFIRCLSYEVGAIKPEKAMYEQILHNSALEAHQVLFVGDTLLADYDGPRQFGFQALHLRRGQPAGNGTISSLMEILTDES